MAALFSLRKPPPTCFYCNTTITPPPPNRRHFICPTCSCTNRYDEQGEIMGDEAAMHDETLNAGSFAKRASPNKSRLPTTYGPGSFCHTCRTNQTLLVNLLSNYLPNPSDPTYESRAASYPSYKESLQQRYPPVCKDCQRMVDEEISKKDYMAQTRILGMAVQQSRKISAQGHVQRLSPRHFWIWRIRGFLWIGTLVLSIALSVLVLWKEPSWNIAVPESWQLVFAFLSIFWIFWDPSWRSIQYASLQGRILRVRGRDFYIRCQMVLWLSRLLVVSLRAGMWSSIVSFSAYANDIASGVSLFLEVLLGILSFRSISVQQAPTLRLISSSRSTPSPVSPRTPPLEPSTEPLFASLTLSSMPSAPTNPKPIFGQPSLVNKFPVVEDDAMDWTPTLKPGSEDEQHIRVVDREDWLRPAKFFAPEPPTGLEGLLEKTSLIEEEEMSNVNAHALPQGKQLLKLPPRHPNSTGIGWIWFVVYAMVPLVLMVVGGTILKWWRYGYGYWPLDERTFLESDSTSFVVTDF
ncbi:hypothetical protein SISNIDRAFT_408239 [Sistotremastrum niveocremeum HHB9708]|uniref:Ima1 N-terminal domain-containing protein n=1 Tax=Sistotremastrum niveocremeum HHB9708 TaxID=1314777 RepID=A0A164X9G4_9AGAM|nr:hypothetical protein SISNIDRAFT_408239 [Sistotremastrum niveocremeum HHB9708]